MLQGITNISTGTDFSEVKKDRRPHGKHRAYLNTEENEDLTEFSPAFKYLSRLNWQIHKIDVNDKDKVTVNFSVFGFLFKLTIDLSLIPHSKKVYLSAKKKLMYKTLEMVLSFPFVVDESETLENFSLENLDLLFTRIEYLVRTGRLNPLESKVSYGVYEDIISGLLIELQRILYALLVFAEKLTSKNIIKNITNNGSNLENFRIENVEIC